jgi:ABC-2 type transport system ATP-binding protein
VIGVVADVSPIVETKKLTHTYGLRVALHELTFAVNEGEAVAMLGPNGSGKTTLFRILTTLIPPMDGVARILGYDLASEREAVRPFIGVVFQSPSLDKQLTAEENLMYHGHLYGLRGGELKSRARDLLARVDLADRAHERVGTFSGGMRRRVELAKGLLNRPRLLLLDEPSTGLDPAARQELWNYLQEVRLRDGVTILLTTHLMDEADQCDRVAILDRGKLVAYDSPTNLKERVGGDVITLTTRNAPAVKELLLEKLGMESEVSGAAVRLERPRAHELVPSLIENLPGLVEAVHVGKPTLADVFMDATGRSLSEE